MHNEVLSILRCPVCKEGLSYNRQTCSCIRKHSFDIAREGYLNLLLAKKGVGREQGDTREMLEARTSFYNKGYFNFISHELKKKLDKYVSRGSLEKTENILEIGCGQGHHLRQLSVAFPRENIGWYGVDVSKDAVRMASRRLKNGAIILANVHHEIPFIDRSISFLFAIFAPRNFGEFDRILRHGGSCVVVIPTRRHLHELRAHIKLLAIDEDKEQQVIEAASKFDLIDAQTIEHTAELSREDLHLLLTMTPNYRHLKSPSAALADIDHLGLTFSVRMLHFERCAHGD